MPEMRVQFFGRVQGVAFRATARDIALGFGIVGTVKNLPDGSVELFAQGSREVLELMLQEIGSQFRLDPERPMAVEYYAPIQEFADFKILY